MKRHLLFAGLMMILVLTPGQRGQNSVEAIQPDKNDTVNKELARVAAAR